MNNSKTKRWLVFVALLIVGLQGCSKSTPAEISACFQTKTSMKAVRVDDKNHRIFAVHKPVANEEVVNRLRSSAECFSNSDWSKDWSVSLFADEKYAGYKDEPRIVPYHKNNEWAKAYLGEFDGQSNIYTHLPAIDKPMPPASEPSR